MSSASVTKRSTAETLYGPAFVNKSKTFVTVADIAGLQTLVSAMSNHARAKAGDKIKQNARVQALTQNQLSLAI